MAAIWSSEFARVLAAPVSGSEIALPPDCVLVLGGFTWFGNAGPEPEHAAASQV